ncbi:hypothetical protein [Amycolatopsis dendrobii]|uniref:Uncharacterized protein n=1 Tax=Amycolatopsis dendrobii TaxID=2760662 RepID=A0A7W3VUN3_9PSEU|nr:hypothetical protein [Amycolatopsis dendrobii]MBB1153543.1 hypothetical protein [Amycolatopsis dendrobii]
MGDLQSRLDHEVLAEIEQARLAEFQRLAEKEASERAMADTTVIPRVEHANGALSPVPPVGDCRSYAGIKPRNEAAQQVRFFSP